MPLEPVIRRAHTGDAAALAALGRATFTETFGRLYRPADLAAFLDESHSADHYRRLLEAPEVALWVAEPPTSPPVAYAIAGPCKLPVTRLEARAGELRSLYVLSTAQGNGLGTRMLEIVLAWLREQRFSPLYIGVWSENFGAQRLYGRYGFTKVGEYDFPVGAHLDREFILRERTPGS
jgi:ribosomal protein S18 acetylase RimI-like enzyme